MTNMMAATGTKFANLFFIICYSIGGYIILYALFVTLLVNSFQDEKDEGEKAFFSNSNRQGLARGTAGARRPRAGSGRRPPRRC